MVATLLLASMLAWLDALPASASLRLSAMVTGAQSPARVEVSVQAGGTRLRAGNAERWLKARTPHRFGAAVCEERGQAELAVLMRGPRGTSLWTAAVRDGGEWRELGLPAEPVTPPAAVSWSGQCRFAAGLADGSLWVSGTRGHGPLRLPGAAAGGSDPNELWMGCLIAAMGPWVALGSERPQVSWVDLETHAVHPTLLDAPLAPGAVEVSDGVWALSTRGTLVHLSPGGEVVTGPSTQTTVWHGPTPWRPRDGEGVVFGDEAGQVWGYHRGELRVLGDCGGALRWPPVSFVTSAGTSVAWVTEGGRLCELSGSYAAPGLELSKSGMRPMGPPSLVASGEALLVASPVGGGGTNHAEVAALPVTGPAQWAPGVWSEAIGWTRRPLALGAGALVGGDRGRLTVQLDAPAAALREAPPVLAAAPPPPEQSRRPPALVVEAPPVASTLPWGSALPWGLAAVGAAGLGVGMWSARRLRRSAGRS